MSEAESGRATRRGVLAGAGALGAATVLAACSGSGDSSSTPAGNAATGGGSPGEVLAKTSQIPVGGGVIFDQPQVVVTQPTQGSFKAFSAICTHQGCPVSSVSNGLINCPCHGSQYSITDGSVKRAAMQGQQGLAAKQITVSGDSITLA